MGDLDLGSTDTSVSKLWDLVIAWGECVAREV